MAAESSITAFQQASGGNGALVLEVVDSNQNYVEQKSLATPFAVIGREPHSDVLLDHEQVGRRHAFLQVLTGKAFCFDMESRTGTRWSDGRRFSSWIKPSEAIHIGPYQLRVQPGEQIGGEATWDPLQPCGPEMLPTTPVTLEFLNGATRKRCWQVDRALTLVGHAPGCKLRLRSRSAGQFHCYLAATPDGIWVVDLLSTAGVFRNGQPVRFARLDDGDQLLIGSFLIQCHHGTLESTATSTSNFRHSAVDRSNIKTTPLTAAAEPEFVGSALALRLPAHGAITADGEDRVLTMMSQFSQMQMQMFDQFQQTMMMMFQMFGTLQQEQVAALRDELDQVRELTQELQTLQKSLAQAGQPMQQQPPSSYQTPPDPVEFAPAVSKAATAAPEPPPSGHANGHVPPKAAGPAAANGRPKASQDGRTPGDLHAMLLQRMETIEQERQSRWQKILGLLGGKKQ